MRETVGIDFGTSTTLIGRRTGQWTARVVPIGDTTSWMATVAAVGDDGGLVIGDRSEGYPEGSIIRSVKSQLGAGVEKVAVRRPDGGEAMVDVDAVVQGLLADAIRRSEAADLDYRGKPIRMACPAHWDREARSRLVECAKAAGLDTGINDLLDEPIAAGVSWVMHQLGSTGRAPEGRVVVFDAGGGTLDIAVLEVTGVNPPEITVLSSISRSEAGDRLDETVAGELKAELEEAGHLDGDPDPELEALLRLAGRRLKEGLTFSEEQSTRVGGRFDSLPPLTYRRSQLEHAFAPQLERAVSLVDAALLGAELRRRQAPSPSEMRRSPIEPLRDKITWILLSGGMTRMPAIAARLGAVFRNARITADEAVGSPQESVVTGLAFDDVVSELNLHRPAFDFRVEYRLKGRVIGSDVVYPAFTPLYQSEQVFRGEGHLGFTSRLRRPAGVSGPVLASITCRSLEGQVLELHLDDARVSAIEVPLDVRGDGTFKLYVDGRIVVRGERDLSMRVERWPVLHPRGKPPTVVLRTHDLEDWRRK